MDIRSFLSTMWQLIASLCRSAAHALDDAIAEFGSEPLITFQVSTESLLEVETQSRLEEARRLASEHFTRDLMTIHTISQINGFMTGLMTNFYTMTPVFQNLDSLSTVLFMEQYFLSNNQITCRCHRDQSCQAPAGPYLFHSAEYDAFNDLNLLVANMVVPGILFDCLPILATFASSLECFYNRSCINLLQQIYAKSINVSTLDTSKASRFSVTTPLKQMIEELFLEEIINTTSFSGYFDQCAPISCTYTYSQRFDRVFVITTLVGLIGGLNAALRFVAPQLIKIFFLMKRKLFQEAQEGSNLDRGMTDDDSDFR